MRRRFAVALLTVAACGLSASAAAAEQLRSGQAAIDHLGTEIDEVAAAHGITGPELAQELREDSSLHVDESDNVFYLDEGPSTAGATEEGAAGEGGDAPFPLPQTFSLHSDPGSDRILYLDFDGGTYGPHILWNGQVTIPAFTGGPETVQRIWQRVAEDFAPFGIDVTTEEPPAEDLEGCADRCGARISIGGHPRDAGFPTSVNGAAPLGLSVGVWTEPTAVVFPVPLEDDEVAVADVVAHEAGHTFGLLHDGTRPFNPLGGDYYPGHGSGATSWCPIMGNCFGRELSQWSHGEYPGANNPEEDDVAVIAATAPLRADDVLGTAQLGGEPHAVDQAGLIASRSDTDHFAFAGGAGPATFTVAGAPRGPNLDAELTLLDSSGAIVAQANDPDGLGATLTVALTTGRYVLRVDGVGDTIPLPGYSDYDSLGRYRITGTYRPAAPTTLAAQPALLRLRPFGLPLVRLSATLRKAGAPYAARTVSFSANGRHICSAVTDGQGVASCSGFASLLDLTLDGGYDAEFAGDPDALPSTARGALIGSA